MFLRRCIFLKYFQIGTKIRIPYCIRLKIISFAEFLKDSYSTWSSEQFHIIILQKISATLLDFDCSPSTMLVVNFFRYWHSQHLSHFQPCQIDFKLLTSIFASPLFSIYEREGAIMYVCRHNRICTCIRMRICVYT